MRALSLCLFLFAFTATQAQNFSSSFLAYNNLCMEKADLDGDGDLDLISGGLYCLSWEENLGNGVFVNHVLSQSQPEVQCVYPVDLDQDGRLDIITASLSNSVVYWVRNLGNNQFAQTSIATATGGAVAVAAADFDNDGDLDIAGAGFTGNRVFLLTNNGNQVFAQTELLNLFTGAISLSAGDMDNDGDADILAAARDADRVVWFRNNGTGTFTTSNISTSMDSPFEVKLYDFDNDTDLDVIYASNSGWGWYRNQSGLFAQQSFNANAGIQTIDASDLNNDGILDLVIGNTANDYVTYVLITATQTLGTGGVVDNLTNAPEILVCGDFNNDNRNDVFIGSDFDIRLALNQPDLSFTKIQIAEYASNNNGACHGDFDNDGDIDLMETGFTFMYWFQNQGNGEYTPIRLADNGLSWINTQGGTYIRSADMDGDGDDDAVFSENDNNRVSWIENRGGGLFSLHTAFTVMGPYSVEPLDFDNDGDMDVVTTSTANDAVYWFENNGSQTFTQRLVNASYWDPFESRTADYDNDGDMDVFVAQGNPSNKLLLFRNGGNNSTFTAIEIDASAPGMNSVHVVDLDQDGDLDLLSASSTDDRVSWYRSSGGAFPTFTKLTVSTGVDGATYVYAGDYDNDGDLDVVASSFTDKSVSFFKNDGSQSFTRQVLANTIDGSDFVESGDLDGDGVEEIYATGSTHGIVQIFKNTPFVLPPAIPLQPCADLFISEVVEGSSWNKAVELYNPTSQPIDLSPYRILIYANGATSPTQTIVPNGTALPGDVWVYVHILADLDFWFAGDLDGQLNFDGNDAIALTKNGDIIDLMGIIGNDPGANGWSGAPDSSTANHTLVRRPEITRGRNTQGSSFDPTDEWICYQNDAWQYIGNHTGLCATGCVPTVSISASANDICAGTSVTFTATTTNAGAAPIYQWKRNGTNVGSNSATYTASNFSDNEVILCTLVSNASCAIPGTYSSNSITLNVLPANTASISISTPSTTVCTGASVTFTATLSGGGTAPVLQWKKNGSNVGSNSTTYTASGLVSGDIITCQLSSNAPCTTTPVVTSNALTITVVSSLTPSVSISASATSICSGANITFTATPVNGGTSPSYQWKRNGTNVGSNAATFSSTTLVNGDIITCVLTSNASCLSSTTATSNALTITVTSLPATPTLSISTTSTTVCAGTSLTFTATVTNGGTSPVYQWKKNGSNVGSNSSTYTNATWTNGDQITCTVSSSNSCGTASGTSNTLTITVTAPLTPSVSISASATTICAGTSVTFTPTAVNGGSTPTWSWLKNGNPIGNTFGSYTTPSLQNGDVVQVVMTSSLACVTAASATSNAITITVNPTVSPSLSISASATSFCAGTSVSFTATPTNGGNTPAYQWKRNGNNVGSNSASYSSSTLSNGDIITCVLSSNATCVSPATATSNALTLTVNPLPTTPTVSISTTTTSICENTALNFTASASNAGSSPVYQWKRNGSNVGSNSNTYSNATWTNGDQITCTVSNTNSCGTASGTSNAVTLTVNPPVTPSVSISTPSTTLCQGETATFTASLSNGGNAPSYQWWRNGSIDGLNSATFTSSAIQNGDQIYCVVFTNASCQTASSAQSNTLTMTVNNPGLAQVSISTPSTSICEGDTLTIGSTLSGFGSDASYLWLLNGSIALSFAPGNLEIWGLQQGDAITCQVSGSGNCAGNATSNALVFNVTTVPAPVLSSDGPYLLAQGSAAPQFEWEYNGNVLPGASNDSLLAFQAGFYRVRALSGGCASPWSNTLEQLITSVTEASNAVSLYPNPGNQRFFVHSNAPIRSIELYDATGRCVLQTTSSPCDASQLAAGMYWVRINGTTVKKWVRNP